MLYLTYIEQFDLTRPVYDEIISFQSTMANEILNNFLTVLSKRYLTNFGKPAYKKESSHRLIKRREKYLLQIFVIVLNYCTTFTLLILIITFQCDAILLFSIFSISVLPGTK